MENVRPPANPDEGHFRTEIRPSIRRCETCMPEYVLAREFQGPDNMPAATEVTAARQHPALSEKLPAGETLR